MASFLSRFLGTDKEPQKNSQQREITTVWDTLRKKSSDAQARQRKEGTATHGTTGITPAQFSGRMAINSDKRSSGTTNIPQSEFTPSSRRMHGTTGITQEAFRANQQRMQNVEEHRPSFLARKQVNRFNGKSGDIKELDEKDYLALTPEQRAAVDFNTSLVNAVKADKEAGLTLKDVQDSGNYSDTVKDLFGDKGSDTYAPRTVALLESLDTDDNQFKTKGYDLDNFLDLQATITDQDFKLFDRDSEKPGVREESANFLTGQTQSKLTGLLEKGQSLLNGASDIAKGFNVDISDMLTDNSVKLDADTESNFDMLYNYIASPLTDDEGNFITKDDGSLQMNEVTNEDLLGSLYDKGYDPNQFAKYAENRIRQDLAYTPTDDIQKAQLDAFTTYLPELRKTITGG